MAVYFNLAQDGSFTVGDSVTGRTAYAYPSSYHANEAKRDSHKTSVAMLNAEGEQRSTAMHDSQLARDYDLRNWKRLYDAEESHTARAIIDTIMERRS